MFAGKLKLLFFCSFVEIVFICSFHCMCVSLQALEPKQDCIAQKSECWIMHNKWQKFRVSFLLLILPGELDCMHWANVCVVALKKVKFLPLTKTVCFYQFWHWGLFWGFLLFGSCFVSRHDYSNTVVSECRQSRRDFHCRLHREKHRDELRANKQGGCHTPWTVAILKKRRNPF